MERQHHHPITHYHLQIILGFQLINLQSNEAQYDHVLMDFTNSFGKNIQVAHFMGDVEDNPNLLEGHVPYFSTIVTRSETKEIPLMYGHTTIRIIYDNHPSARLISAGHDYG